MNFARIPGHQETIEKLIKSVKENRVSHAQLFTGPEGCGSLAVALAFAQYISCENRHEKDSCGTCKSCIKYEKMIHPDLHFVYPVLKKKGSSEEPTSDDYLPQWREFISNSPFRSINEWFEMIGSEESGQGMIYTAESSEIIRKLSLKPYESDFKIMIIWLPERMNQTSANKLLKLVEEPPEKTLFLMVSDEPDKIIPTILSRCQLVKIPAFKNEEIKSYLRNTLGATEKEADEIARLSQGNLLRAISIFEKDEATTQNLENFRTLMRHAWKRDIAAMIEWADRMASTGRETQKNFLEYSLRLLRENLMLSLKQHQKELVFLSDEEAAFSEKFHPYITTGNCNKLAEEFNKAALHIEANGYAKLVFLDLALKVTKLIR
ncbi:MAG TPA: DNA polymerase III subunit delta' [Bacteroidales bacterium]|nr:DNA polymerase III subunit delta' [Bacteroidales bacterium]HOK74022.1 DNA polymerase III subunit delta' [Bacteroidales bacterium]HOM40814.1 DNA polymerase III subunit delta' [Bacteroidales bacterium]HPP92522.1 DNA polymerase III subunit delta' [Bacteroidales bacterium]HQK69909.1 DNA polymerase III subunit delta' [Bacteroidales bacterium]